MARKRGGLAGLYDRNKGVIRMLAPAVVGAIPGLGPLAAAGLGAAMRGLDREGKRGIGFDLGQGIRGGLEGYGAGLAGKSVAGGVKGMLAPKTAIPKVDMATINTDIARGLGAGPTPSIPMPTGAITAPTTTPAATSITARAGEAAGAAAKRESGRLSRATQFLESRPKTMEAVTKGIQMALPPQERQSDMMAAETARNRLAMEQTQIDRENQRQAGVAEMLMPMYRQMAERRGLTIPGMTSQSMAARGLEANTAPAPSSLGSYAQMMSAPDAQVNIGPGSQMGRYMQSQDMPEEDYSELRETMRDTGRMGAASGRMQSGLRERYTRIGGRTF